ncbi:MAG: hypothetical protein ACJ74Q_12415 [Pyrinomonadaceae bacterium]
MTLIHVTTADTDTTFPQMLLRRPHELSVTGAHSSNWTRKSEEELNLKANVYFYAGVAFAVPYGGTALVFGPECAAKHTGSATLFNTGDVAHGKLKLDLRKKGDTLRAFVHRNLIPLRRWREEFRKHLAAHFSDPAHYFDGEPCVPGPNELFSMNKDRPSAWRYEVRFREGQNLFDVLEWSGRPGLKIRLLKEAKELAALSDADVLPRLNQFIGRAIIPQGSAHGQEIIEETQRRARGRMGL